MTTVAAGRSKTYDLVYSAVFAVVMAVCSWISIPAQVPFTLQTFGVFMAVGVLGGKRGTLAVLVYVLLGAVGVPVFAGFSGGIGALLGNAGGYIIGFIFSALVMWAFEHVFGRKPVVQIISMIVGLIVCYAFGTAWFMFAYTRSTGPVSIPRPLNMAMSGIRDMSLIEEAPGERHPVQTYVIEYDAEILQEAMEREINRGGQCYYLHNNVETIEHKAMMIKKAIPQARVGIAHGQMSEEELSSVWRDLLSGDIDILVCTTIIETGVDVPNCNTLIIENADRMGLAQLHQIRGRVGRSSRRAYAYFTFTRGKELTDIATRRLEAIREYTEFGSGFKIAMRDLEIRGAGSLLGNRQHGHMEAVGYDMYLKLLEEAVAMEKGEISEEEPEERECLIDVQIDAHLPEEYIISTSQRLSMYKRIAAIKNEADAQDVYDELTDRFGAPPSSVWGLIEIALLRNSAKALGITDIVQRNGSVLFYSSEPDIKTVAILNAFMKGRVTLSAAKRPYIAVKLDPTEATLETIRETLRIMSEAKEHYNSNK